MPSRRRGSGERAGRRRIARRTHGRAGDVGGSDGRRVQRRAGLRSSRTASQPSHLRHSPALVLREPGPPPPNGTYTGDPPPGLTARGTSLRAELGQGGVLVVWSPQVRRVVREGVGGDGYVVGHRLVDEFLEFAAGRAR